MRAVIQRVTEASVSVDGRVISAIGPGLLTLVCAEEGDTEQDALYMSGKIPKLRIFEDDEGKMNRSLLELGGQLLIVSQFTLAGDARHGRRPSFSTAARPDLAVPLLERLIADVRDQGIDVLTGQFQAEMKVALVNDGPVTILMDSRKGF